MKHIFLTSIFAASLLAACGQASHDGHDMNDSSGDMSAISVFDNGAMRVENVAIRPPLPGRSTAMASFSITNISGQDDVLVAVSSPISDNVELHTVLTEGEVRKMRRLENGLALPQGETVILKGGADHIMIFDADMAKDSKMVPMTLEFKNGDSLDVMARSHEGMDDHSGH